MRTELDIVILLEEYDFFDAVELYLQNGVPSELESLEQWKQLTPAQKLEVEKVYTFTQYDIQDSIFRVYIDSIFPDDADLKRENFERAMKEINTLFDLD